MGFVSPTENARLIFVTADRNCGSSLVCRIRADDGLYGAVAQAHIGTRRRQALSIEDGA